MFNHTEQKRVFVQSYRKGLSVNKSPLRLACLYAVLHIVSKHDSSCLKSADRQPIFHFMFKKKNTKKPSKQTNEETKKKFARTQKIIKKEDIFFTAKILT